MKLEVVMNYVQLKVHLYEVALMVGITKEFCEAVPLPRLVEYIILNAFKKGYNRDSLLMSEVVKQYNSLCEVGLLKLEE